MYIRANSSVDKIITTFIAKLTRLLFGVSAEFKTRRGKAITHKMQFKAMITFLLEQIVSNLVLLLMCMRRTHEYTTQLKAVIKRKADMLLKAV